MIGYYVHHQGNGHCNRAVALAQVLDRPVCGLSSLEAPPGWAGDWLRLARDDVGSVPRDPTAHGRLHWSPLLDEGLAVRWHELSHWIATDRPEAVVVDVSVEATLLVRLHGVPVVGVVLPGHRHDPAHLFAYDVCDELVGAWPAEAGDGMTPDLPSHVADRIRPIGGIARHPIRAERERRPGPNRVVLMTGAGGHGLRPDRLRAAQEQTPHWEWTVLSRELGTWVADPRAAIEDADVVITHAGQGAIAEVAAARRPAVVVPQSRPFGEQLATASVLADGWPVVVEAEFPADRWADRLDRVARMDPDRWRLWCDGLGAQRLASAVEHVASVGAGA